MVGHLRKAAIKQRSVYQNVVGRLCERRQHVDGVGRELALLPKADVFACSPTVCQHVFTNQITVQHHQIALAELQQAAVG